MNTLIVTLSYCNDYLFTRLTELETQKLNSEKLKQVIAQKDERIKILEVKYVCTILFVFYEVLYNEDALQFVEHQHVFKFVKNEKRNHHITSVCRFIEL